MAVNPRPVSPSAVLPPPPLVPLPKALGIPPRNPPTPGNRTCFLPEIKGLSVEIPQEGGPPGRASLQHGLAHLSPGLPSWWPQPWLSPSQGPFRGI